MNVNTKSSFLRVNKIHVNLTYISVENFMTPGDAAYLNVNIAHENFNEPKFTFIENFFSISKIKRHIN
jgi:hypothetical protein